MNLQENIRKILREETEDLSSFIENMLTKILVNKNKDILCGVKVIHPTNRESLSDRKFTSYKVTFIFIGGYGTKNWPKTQRVVGKYETIMNKGWDLIYDYTDLAVDVYSTEVKKCDY